MILIADSGSTKCSWAMCNKKGEIVSHYNTIGFNPYFINQSEILERLQKSNLTECQSKITHVFFYGAGCGLKEENNIIEESLMAFFKTAKVIIKNDLDAACYAIYNGEPNITCILGTGSNSCYFDGEHMISSAPSLGFLIGDEASGNYFGKKLINLYLNNVLPNYLKDKFESNYEFKWDAIKKNIYGNKKANVYLAKYFPFIFENKDDPMIKDLIFKGLNQFFQLHVCCYNNYQTVNINFVGSVAYYLSDEIHKIAKKYKCKVGGIIKSPIEKLVEFHFRK